MPRGRVGQRGTPRDLGGEIKVRIVPCHLCPEFFKGERAMTYEFVLVLTVPGVDGLLPSFFPCLSRSTRGMQDPAAFDGRRGEKNLPRIKTRHCLGRAGRLEFVVAAGHSLTLMASDGFHWGATMGQCQGKARPRWATAQRCLLALLPSFNRRLGPRATQ